VALVTSCPTNKFWGEQRSNQGKNGDFFGVGDSWSLSLRFALSNEALVFADRTQGVEEGGTRNLVPYK